MPGRLPHYFTTAALSCLFASQAHATLLLTLDRISDTRASLTITGRLDPAAPGVATANNHILLMDNPFGTGPTGNSYTNALLSSTLKDGSMPVTFAYASGGANQYSGNTTPDLYFGTYGTLPTSQDFTGALELTLPTGMSFATNGSSGNVYWGIFGTPALAGTWQMGTPASVPEPASAALLLAGVAGLALARRRKH